MRFLRRENIMKFFQVTPWDMPLNEEAKVLIPFKKYLTMEEAAFYTGKSRAWLYRKLKWYLVFPSFTGHVLKVELDWMMNLESKPRHYDARRDLINRPERISNQSRGGFMDGEERIFLP